MSWSCAADNIPVPVLYRIPIAPEYVVELIKCGCGKSKYSRRCTSRENNLPYAEVCGSGTDKDCSNTLINYRDQQVDEDSNDNS